MGADRSPVPTKFPTTNGLRTRWRVVLWKRYLSRDLRDADDDGDENVIDDNCDLRCAM